MKETWVINEYFSKRCISIKVTEQIVYPITIFAANLGFW